jgi:imidazole glycerol-phosphate synthase subunit HisF
VEAEIQGLGFKKGSAVSGIRLIARLDIKGANLIKGIQMEGLRIVGSPNEYAKNYYSQGVDELLYIDSVASLYGRNHLADIIKFAAKDIFVPMTVGGGIRSINDVNEILRAGADKVAVNTAAVLNPMLIKDIAYEFGSQCMVLSVEAKKIGTHKWEVYINNGRESTKRDVLDWCREAEQLGAGEILLTSIDMDGTKKGFDLGLIKTVSSKISVPIIASGGMGKIEDFNQAVLDGGADAVAVASALHYRLIEMSEIRKAAKNAGITMRNYGSATSSSH